MGQEETHTIDAGVIALYLIRKGSELLGLNVRVELDVQRALPVSIAPSLAWRTILLACWGAEQRPEFGLALTGECDRRTVR
jgi:hypothetical protein